MTCNSSTPFDTGLNRHPGHAGILVLRLWIGLSMFLIHGIAKMATFSATISHFRDKIGIPAPLGITAVLAETITPVMIVFGFATRLAAFVMSIQMTVAFVLVHHLSLAQGDPASGELAFIYLGAFTTLIFTGGGDYSVDKRLFK